MKTRNVFEAIFQRENIFCNFFKQKMQLTTKALADFVADFVTIILYKMYKDNVGYDKLV